MENAHNKKRGNADEANMHHQFVPLSHILLASNTFRNKFMTKKRFRTYVWLRRYIVRGELKASPVNVYNLYYMQGNLATSYPLSRLAKDLNISKPTAGDHINQLTKGWWSSLRLTFLYQGS